MSVPEKDGPPRQLHPVLPLLTPDWTIGRRVSRPDGRDAGTIVEAGSEIKVKWDSGRTSYFERGKVANVRLEDVESSN
jgi:hypothetical protein